MSSRETNIIPIEEVFKMRYLEQYVQTVVNYSSRYNNQCSYSYAPINLVGKYVKYPCYGDFPETYFLRSYGKWWKTSKASQKEYRPQDFDLLAAEDYVTLEFGSVVIPREIFIYEVYNPGAIVRIWGRLKTTPNWVLLWEGFPQKCAPRSRKFSPPLRKLNVLINLVRIEFNQNHLEYHTALDAVLLCGYQPESQFQYEIIKFTEVNILKALSTITVSDVENERKRDKDPIDNFSMLPNEIILKILEYLDLKSLSRCAQVNTRLNKLCQNQALYQNISLKIYWYLVDSKALEFFKKKIGNIKKLDLSWCNETQLSFNRRLHFDYYSKLQSILESSSQTITHLCLNNNYFVDDELLHRIAACTELKDLRLHHTFNWIRSPLDKLGHLVTLDLSLTNIIDQDLIQILISNPHLEHLVLDLCEKLVLIDSIVETVTLCNKKLKTWSSWKAYSFTSAGIRKFGSCENLEELDLGWCLMCRDPGDCLAAIANGCKKLRRLILSEWRGVTDQLLMPIIHSCKELTQIDLIGIKGITAESCEKALFLLPKLRLLDVSFCDSLRQHEVEIWREQYPHITIQRSHSDYS
ncbi:F-box/LRR-repeat protein 4 isoform X1 [Anthonomus grandis grandis]|uniref:F-box/LRR-repeat protein 4 isoform X1 n=1 Tax=Anthonomus grandis grandis TaxID=2921223 RepID=UPI002165D0FF|nr:F-box/LRR-repeat protein 4 isoform X1 [Anthonomus grandis grandis]